MCSSHCPVDGSRLYMTFGLISRQPGLDTSTTNSGLIDASAHLRECMERPMHTVVLLMIDFYKPMVIQNGLE